PFPPALSFGASLSGWSQPRQWFSWYSDWVLRHRPRSISRWAAAENSWSCRSLRRGERNRGAWADKEWFRLQRLGFFVGQGRPAPYRGRTSCRCRWARASSVPCPGCPCADRASRPRCHRSVRRPSLRPSLRPERRGRVQNRSGEPRPSASFVTSFLSSLFWGEFRTLQGVKEAGGREGSVNKGLPQSRSWGVRGAGSAGSTFSSDIAYAVSHRGGAGCTRKSQWWVYVRCAYFAIQRTAASRPKQQW